MFEVRCISPLDDEWEERDILIRQTAGRISDSSGASFVNPRQRDHSWNVPAFEEAKELMDKLNSIPLVQATMQEAMTYHRKKKFKK